MSWASASPGHFAGAEAPNVLSGAPNIILNVNLCEAPQKCPVWRRLATSQFQEQHHLQTFITLQLLAAQTGFLPVSVGASWSWFCFLFEHWILVWYTETTVTVNTDQQSTAHSCCAGFRTSKLSVLKPAGRLEPLSWDRRMNQSSEDHIWH